jgi:lipoprotein-releasing system permease protein
MTTFLTSWSLRHRRLVVAAWVAVLVVVNLAAMSFGGESKQDFLAPGTESKAAVELLEQRFPDQAGDTITIVTPRGASTPFGTAPRIKAYPVKAIFEIGMTEFDGTFVYMPLNEAQAYFNRDGDVNVIEIFVDNPDRTQAVRDAIEADAPRPLVLSDWRQRNRSFFNALEVERNVMFIILTLIVLVAALNIVSGLIMLVKDKTADIAIMRTMGCTRGTVLRVFLITGAAIGVIGTLAGLALGVVFAKNIKSIMAGLNWITGANLWDPTVRFLSDIPSVIDWSEVTSVVLMALTLSLLATLYPAWKAARLYPVEALRMGESDGTGNARALPLSGRALLSAERCAARSAAQGRFRALAGRGRRPGRAERHRQVDAAACRGPA